MSGNGERGGEPRLSPGPADASFLFAAQCLCHFQLPLSWRPSDRSCSHSPTWRDCTHISGPSCRMNHQNLTWLVQEGLVTCRMQGCPKLSLAPTLWHCKTCFACQQMNNLSHLSDFVLGMLLARSCWLNGFLEGVVNEPGGHGLASERPGGNKRTCSKL